VGTATATCTTNISVQDIVSTGYVVPQTFAQALASPTIAGASITYANGTGAGQIDIAYFKPITLAASTPQTFDLTSLTGLGGESVNFARVREWVLYNPDTHDCSAYKGASNGWAILPASTNPAWARAAGGMARISDPQSAGSGVGNVTSGTSKTFTVDPGSNAMTVYLILLGGSAA
jgi:hypothetical protein